MEHKSARFFSLQCIAEWQLSTNSDIQLPELQRGFVWKANQIETLWDSLLRGFPIGSFLLSKTQDDKFYLLDGQQRATSIALGLHNPWKIEKTSFWSLKNSIPTIWIDIASKSPMASHKFSIRVVTNSHPWGYQRNNHSSILSVSDRRDALEIFKMNPLNNGKLYIKFNQTDVFPYDCNVPVPLSLLIDSIMSSQNWKSEIIERCKTYLPIELIHTKCMNREVDYLHQLESSLNEDLATDIYDSILKLFDVEIPGVIVDRSVLKNEDDNEGHDPTIFVRLNSSGTRISGEELVYSIYKAAFPHSKSLVESIGTSFLSPSMVIALSARLVASHLSEHKYPTPITVNDFIKKLSNQDFVEALKLFIGDDNYSPAKSIYKNVIESLTAQCKVNLPPALIKSIIKSNPDLFLFLLYRNYQFGKNEKPELMLASFTALAWFSLDIKRYIRDNWPNVLDEHLWSYDLLINPFIENQSFLMYPLFSPNLIRNYLIDEVAENNKDWNLLYPDKESEIYSLVDAIVVNKDTLETTFRSIWDAFTNRLVWNRQLLMFAQREYVNENFGEYNQFENLDDTNTPWDWDHIYPLSWIHGLWNINKNMKHWNNTIGNLRLLSLEQNRSENNRVPIKERLDNAMQISFIKDNDWQYWQQLQRGIKDGDPNVKLHLKATINRLINIYEEWYNTLNIETLFSKNNFPVTSKVAT